MINRLTKKDLKQQKRLICKKEVMPAQFPYKFSYYDPITDNTGYATFEAI